MASSRQAKNTTRRSRLGRRGKGVLAALFMGACVAGAVASLTSGCGDWDPTDPFKRNAPEVQEALGLLDAGQYESAEELLGEYLGTGVCTKEGLSIPDKVRQRPNGSFDLGLTLFNLAEEYGLRFGEEPDEDEEPLDEEDAAQRNLEIDCALAVVGAIANDPKVDIGLRARAHYLAGNLEFLRENYQQAIRHYDQALRLIPGMVEEAGGDGIGRDAAHNRAIALRKLEEEQQDAGADAQPDAEDGGGEEPDAGDPSSSGDDAGPDGGGGPDGGEDGGGDPESDDGDQGEDDPPDPGDQGEPPPEPPPSSQPEPEPQAPDEAPSGGADQDERLLDEFEGAPTYQEQEARRRSRSRLRSMEDK
jgi:tetratricopeptide (TPR) repeat protein